MAGPHGRGRAAAEAEMGVRLSRRSAVATRSPRSPAAACSSAAPGGIVYSLSAATGCIHWFFETGRGVRAAISVGARRDAGAACGTRRSSATARQRLRARRRQPASCSGRRTSRPVPVARITGSPTFYDGRLYVPVASGEEGAGAAPTYECCKFRGSVVALDAATGKTVWKTYTIPEDADADEEEHGRHAAVGALRRAGVEQPGDRPAAQRALRHHRQQLQRSGVEHERLVHGDRSRDRQDALVRSR